MDRFEFYKSQFEFEKSRKDKFDNSISIPLGIITALVGINFYYISDFDYQFSKFIKYGFVLFEAIVGVFAILAVHFMIKLYSNWFSGHNYYFLPTTEKLENLYQGHLDYNDNLSDPKSESDKAFTNDIIAYLVEGATTNAVKNDNRSEYLFKANLFIILLVCSTFLSTFLFGSTYFNSKPSSQEVVNQKMENHSGELLQIKNSIDSLSILINKQNTNE